MRNKKQRNHHFPCKKTIFSYKLYYLAIKMTCLYDPSRIDSHFFLNCFANIDIMCIFASCSLGHIHICSFATRTGPSDVKEQTYQQRLAVSAGFP